MTLQWYPGHMTKARRELAQAVPSQQVIIEVLDARLPRSSRNPVIAELGQDKPRLLVLAKSDLADPDATSAHQARLGGPRVEVIAVAASDGARVRLAINAGLARLGHPPSPQKRVRALIAGVPNVGKSTLVNTLVGRAVADVEDRPAVTKAQKQVLLPSGLLLTDTPGILWPKIEDEGAAQRLAFAGSIPDTAADAATMARFGAAILLARYAGLVVARYRLDGAPRTPDELLAEVGRRRGALRAGGVIDVHKAAEILVRDFRAGALGRITLDEP